MVTRHLVASAVETLVSPMVAIISILSFTGRRAREFSQGPFVGALHRRLCGSGGTVQVGGASLFVIIL